MIRASSLQQPLVEMAPDGVALEVDLVTWSLFLAFGLWIPISSFSGLPSCSQLAGIPEGGDLGLEKEQISFVIQTLDIQLC